MKLNLENNMESCKILKVNNEKKDVNEIERNLITKYRKTIWSPFIKGVKEYNLIEEGDKIAVCISGGKDSFLLAKCIEELQKHSKIKFDVEYIAMNPGFNDYNLTLLQNSANDLNINLKIFETKIFDIVEKIAKDYPCYMCAKMRRGSLYDYAQKLGCNKIALGHHFDDIIETTMMNLLYAGKFATMLPKVESTNYENMTLIRPLVYVRENDIKKFTVENGIPVMNCGCVVAAQKTSSKRREVKELLENLRKIDKDIDKSIFSASKNVNLDSIIRYKKNHEYINNIK